MKKKKMLVLILCIAIFLFLEFFFPKPEYHLKYIEESLTKDAATKACEDIIVTDNDIAWLREVVDSISKLPDGEYSQNELNISSHADYPSAVIRVSVTTIPQSPKSAADNARSVVVSLCHATVVDGDMEIGFNVTTSNNQPINLGENKSVGIYSDSIFNKSFPDKFYSFHDQSFKKLTAKHEWFALFKGFFTMK